MADSSPVWRVNRTPRFSVLEMGEYMVTEDGPRETFRRNMKYERMAPTLLHNEVRMAVASFIVSPTRDRSALTRCRTRLEALREAATSPQQRENATYALRALEAFERSLNALPLAGANFESPPFLYPPHIIEGVKISVQPTALIRVARPRGKDLRGAIIVDVAKGVVEPKTDDAKRRLTEAMSFSALLLHEHLGNAVVTDAEKLSAEHCFVFHAHRQELVPSPSNYRRLLRNVEAACRDLAARWDGIVPPPSFDQKLARFRN